MRAIERCMVTIYILIELCILVVINLPVCVFDGDVNIVLMFLSIVLNALVALCFLLIYGRNAPKNRADLIILALYITVIGDLFLTYLGEPFYIPGVFCFCIVETVYAVYLKSHTSSIVLRAVLFSLLFAAAIPTGNVSMLNILSVMNIAILSGNVFDAWRMKAFDPGVLFKLGMTLFFCCDLSLGLSTLLSGDIAKIMGFLIWMFYIPSQVCLTLSYIVNRKKYRSL